MVLKIEMFGYIDDRIKISYKIRTYLEYFIKENIIIPFKLKNKWDIYLNMHLLKDINNYLPKISKPTTISSENVKYYSLFISMKRIRESENEVLAFIEALYDNITIFFTTHYKKITAEYMKGIKAKIDYDYLLSLPYPAPFIEQKYAADDNVPEELWHYFD